MTIIAWKNCVGGSSRRFKGKVRHSALYIILIQIQELKVLWGLFYFHVQERIGARTPPGSPYKIFVLRASIL